MHRMILLSKKCQNNEDGKCYVNQDDCPQIQEFFRNRRKNDVKKGEEK